MKDILTLALESDSELYHHGIEGQKWGERRYQNYDGSLTDAGRKRYGVGMSKRDVQRDLRYLEENVGQSIYNKKRAEKDLNKITGKGAFKKEYNQLSKSKQEKYDKQMQMYADILQNFSKNKDTYVDAVNEAKEMFGDKKISDVRVDKKTGEIMARLPGESRLEIVALHRLMSGDYSGAIFDAAVVPKWQAKKAYKELKKQYK